MQRLLKHSFNTLSVFVGHSWLFLIKFQNVLLNG
ncbi:hypothetical protein ECP03052936_1427, partial [Escherichia coli p0305293.6]